MRTKIITQCAICVCLLTLLFCVGADASSPSQPAPQPALAPTLFNSPEDAVAALLAAAKNNDTGKILEIFGRAAEGVIFSGDVAAGTAERAAFVAAFEEKSVLVPLGPFTPRKDGTQGGSSHRSLEIGAQNWPFPIPLAADGKTGRWYFDAKLGAEEIRNRRVGRNELAAMEVCRAYVDAQREYYRQNPDNGLIRHFAQKVASTPGKRDGLYWETKEGEAPSPLGAFVAAAVSDAHRTSPQGQSGSYYGYRYHILTGQGKNAHHGAYGYIEKGLMFGGFGFIAYPETYGASGIMTFIVNQEGVIYQKNLGKQTTPLAQKITLFDPDKTWSKGNTPEE